jgi:hypothetical protein
MGEPAAQTLFSVRQAVGLGDRVYGPAPGEREEMRRKRGEAERKRREMHGKEKLMLKARTTPPMQPGGYYSPANSHSTPMRSMLRDSPGPRPSELWAKRRMRKGLLTGSSSTGAEVIQHRRKSTAGLETPVTPLFVGKYTPETPSPPGRMYGERVAEQRGQSKLGQSVEQELPLSKMFQQDDPISPDSPHSAYQDSLLAKFLQKELYEQTLAIKPPHPLSFDNKINPHGTPEEVETFKENAKVDHDIAAASLATGPEECNAWRDEIDDSGPVVNSQQLCAMSTRVQGQLAGPVAMPVPRIRRNGLLRA